VNNRIIYLYQESDSLLESLSDFIGRALSAGKAAIIVAAREHREGLRRRLTKQGQDIEKACATGTYVELDAAETVAKIMVGRMPENTRFFETVGGPIERAKTKAKNSDGVVAFGEMVPLLWKEGKNEASIRLEQLWNELAGKHSVSLRCAYPVNMFHSEANAELLLGICAERASLVLEERDKSFVVAGKEIALRRSEERFLMLVDAIEEYAIFILDSDGYISTWNRGAKRIKGYEDSEIIGKHFSLFYPEDDIRAGKPQRELEIAARNGRLEDEGWRLRKDGSRFWANVIITALRDDTGRLIGFGKVTRDFTERIVIHEALKKEVEARREAEERLRESERSLRQLSVRLLETQDEERRRIGRDLHDSVGQYLVALKMKIDLLKSLAERNGAEDIGHLAECVQLAEDAIKDVRTLSYLLYPPMLDELGLKSAISWYLEGFTKRSGIKTTFDVSPEFGRIRGDLELTLFRVLQESLSNVHRHSGSPTALVRLFATDGAANLQIIDQGKGSSAKDQENQAQNWMESFGVGLRSMQERIQKLGGTLKISSTAKGTTVTAIVTCPTPSKQSDFAEEGKK